MTPSERTQAVGYLFIGMLLVMLFFVMLALIWGSITPLGLGIAYVTISLCLWRPAEWLLGSVSEHRTRPTPENVSIAMTIWPISFPVVGAFSAILALTRSVVPRVDEDVDED